jgi:hypothetical protein
MTLSAAVRHLRPLVREVHRRSAYTARINLSTASVQAARISLSMAVRSPRSSARILLPQRIRLENRATDRFAILTWGFDQSFRILMERTEGLTSNLPVLTRLNHPAPHQASLSL